MRRHDAAVKVVGLDDATGYGEAARANVAALRAVGATVHWCPLRPAARRARPFDRQAPCEVDYAASILHVVPEYYPALLAAERCSGADRPVWGYTVWETDRLPGHWPAILNRLDGLFVPSDWNRRVFRDAGVTVPIAIFPHVPSPEPETTAGALPQLAGLGDRFVFYSVAQWSERKAPWLALRAYLAEFDAGAPVAFVLKTDGLDRTRIRRHWRDGFRRAHPSVAEAVARELAAFPAAAPVVLIDAPLDAPAMAALHRAGHCYVSLSRAEGWGLGAYEAAWRGKPVIASDVGGHRCFLPADWPGLVPGRAVPVRGGAAEASYTADQTWAEPELGLARRHMRAWAEAPERAAEAGRRLQRHVTAQFSSPAIARACLEVLGL
jgi:glycosyltransferase involved in cell wall biosynthesis